MFSKFPRPARNFGASKLDQAIIASVAAMLAMNVFVLSQQLAATPQVAVSNTAHVAQQA